MGVILPAESDALAIEGFESMVGDGHAVGITAEVTEHLPGARRKRAWHRPPNPAGGGGAAIAETAFHQPVRRRVRRSVVAYGGRGV